MNKDTFLLKLKTLRNQALESQDAEVLAMAQVLNTLIIADASGDLLEVFNMLIDFMQEKISKRGKN